MLKNILSIFIAIYIVSSTMYLGYILIPHFYKYINKYSYKKTTAIYEAEKKDKNDIKNECHNYSLGYIGSDNSFIIENRLKNTFKEPLSIVNNKISHNIEEISCDIIGNKLNIFYNSKFYLEALISNYEYTSPVSKQNKDLELKTILKPFTSNRIDLSSGYIVAVDRIDKANLKPISWDFSQEEEEIILGTCDTIYFELTGKDPSSSEIEYIAAKTDLNSDGTTDYIVLVNWYDKSLAKGTKYTSIFVLLFDKNNSAQRYTLLPFSTTRNSNFFIEQIIDLDNNGIKEIIVRRVRSFKDNFIIYKLSLERNSFIQVE